MAILNVHDLGAAGVNSDLPAWELPPGALTEVRNVRVRNEQIETTGGTALIPIITPKAAGKRFAHTRQVTNWNGASHWVLLGEQSALAWDGANFFDISPDKYPSFGDINVVARWTSCEIGQTTFYNHPQDFPYYWIDGTPSTVMQDLVWKPGSSAHDTHDTHDKHGQPGQFPNTPKPPVTWRDQGNQCRVMRSHKNFLFALGMTENGTEMFDRFRWSHPADPNGLPYTWDENDDSALAGYAALGDGGMIIDGLSMRDSFVIYSEHAVHVLDYTGDNFVWRVRQVSNSTGMFSKDCVVEVKNVHYFMTEDDVLMFDGNTFTSIMHKRIRRRFAAQLNNDRYINSYAIKHDEAKEIWFCVAEGDNEAPSTAFVYNWLDQTWAIRDLEQNTWSANFGGQPEPAITWDAKQTTWDQEPEPWGSRLRSPRDTTIIGTNGNDLFDLDPEVALTDYETLIERVNLPLLGHDTVTTITRVYPHIEGTQPVKIQFGSHDQAGSRVRWKPAVMFDPDVDRKIDVRTTGELHAWRISSVGRGYYRLTGFDLEYTEAGKR